MKLPRISARSARGLVALVLLGGIGLAVVIGSGGRSSFTPARIQHDVLALGGFGVAGYLAASMARPLTVVLSSSLFAVAAGLLWGPMLGTAVALAGLTLASLLVTGLSRAFGEGAVRELAGARYERFARMAQANGFGFVFVATLGFVLPTDLVVAVATVGRVKTRTVVVATLLGSLPGTLAMAYIGATALKPSTTVLVVGGIAVVALTALAAILARSWFRASRPSG